MDVCDAIRDAMFMFTFVNQSEMLLQISICQLSC